MDSKAVRILKDQFVDWIKKGKWESGIYLLRDLSDEESDTPELVGKLPRSRILGRIDASPRRLAEEIHQIGFDAGLRAMEDFMREYRGRLRRANLSRNEIIDTLDYIDLQSEHSH